jgi:carboxyl-terminal processing protease
MQQNNNTSWLKPISYALMIILGIVIGVFVKGNLSVGDFLSKNQNPIHEIMELVNSKYVDSLTNDSASIKVADFYLGQLDPHSVYIPPADLVDVNDQLAANLKGIGIEFQQFRDSFFVSYVLKEGPAEKAGMHLGDILLKANDSIVLSGGKLQADEVRQKVKGPAETPLNLSVLRNNQIVRLKITRANIAISPIDAFYMINDTLGYIKLNKFTDRTYEAFMQALEPLLQKGMKSLVLDLRNNGGGLMGEAVAIADELLSGNKLIVYTQGAHSARTDYYSKREGLFEQGKLTILMNESSASASEVLAGALQDWDRATIVGTRSFGKGLVQQQFKLSNGGALRLTTAKYYTPLGRNIQRPYLQGKEAYEDAYIKRLHEDAMGMQDSNFKGNSFKTPKGNLVYGGGGIYPNKWVVTHDILMDTSTHLLGQNNLLNEFVLQFYLSHIPQMQALKNGQELIKQYQNEATWNAFIQFANTRHANMIKKEMASQKIMQNHLVALLARMRWYKQGYQEVVNSLDPQFALMIE